MAYPINRIAGFNFIAIIGGLDQSAPMVSVDSWPGVDGVDFTDEGKKGSVFSVFTITDANDRQTADILVRAYKDLIGQGSVSIVQDDSLSIDRFKVLAVRPLPIQAIQFAVGNKQSVSAGALLQCQWDLMAIP